MRQPVTGCPMPERSRYLSLCSRLTFLEPVPLLLTKFYHHAQVPFKSFGCWTYPRTNSPAAPTNSFKRWPARIPATSARLRCEVDAIAEDPRETTYIRVLGFLRPAVASATSSPRPYCMREEVAGQGRCFVNNLILRACTCCPLLRVFSLLNLACARSLLQNHRRASVR